MSTIRSRHHSVILVLLAITGAAPTSAQQDAPSFEICEFQGSLIETPRASTKRGTYDLALRIESALPLRIGPQEGSTDCQEYVTQELLVEALPVSRKQLPELLPGVRVSLVRSAMDKADRRGNYLRTEVRSRLQSIQSAAESAHRTP